MGLKKINIDRPDSNAIDSKKNRRIVFTTLLFYLKERFYLENLIDFVTVSRLFIIGS